jgi:DNA-binding SARP family transcriptional activator/tetratricopeptide (TPR) repeat protein
MRINLLGPVEVVRDGIPRPVTGSRRKAVLAVLALRRGEVVGVERLVDSVWAAGAPPTVANSLQQHVSQLRQVLGDRSAIVARSPGYLLPAEAAETDVAVAERLIREATESTDPAVRADRLRSALALWRGASLADVSTLPWLDDQARRLDELRLRARRDLTEAEQAIGNDAALLPELAELAAAHPFDEQLHARLILALYRAGRQADALNVYQQLRGRLRRELGIDPSPPLRELETAILRQDAGLAPPAGTAPAPAPATSRSLTTRVPAQLPAAVPAFTGRAHELRELDVALADTADGVMVIMAVSGSGGVGKTALAVHWAQRAAPQFPDGQIYADLRGFGPEGTTADPAEVVRGFLDAFGVPASSVPAGLTTQAALYRSLVAGRRVLVVLDNARDAAQVRPLLPGTPGCLVVITSRNLLTPLVATEGARPLPLAPLTAEEASSLLARRLGTARAAAEPAAVAEIVTRCARLPLSLVVVAAQAATRPALTLTSLAAQLRQRRGDLAAFHAGDEGTDVRAVFSWSYRRLSDPAARLFRLLGLHPGPDAGVSAAAALTGASPAAARRLLAELAEASLVSEPVADRFSMHDLLRAYATECALDQDEADTRRAAQRRLLDHLLHSVQACTRVQYGEWQRLDLPPAGDDVPVERFADPAAANAWFGAEQRVLIAAIGQSSATAGLEGYAWRLTWSLSLIMEAHALWREAVTVGRIALDAATRSDDRAGRAHAEHALGMAYSWLGRDDEALLHLTRSRWAFGALGDRSHQAQVCFGIGLVHDRRGEDAEARDQSALALELYREIGDRRGQALALGNMGWSMARMGDLETALTFCRESLAVHQELGDVQGIAGSWDSLGLVHQRSGRLDDAVTCYRAAVELWGQMENSFQQANTMTRLGDVHAEAGQADEARDCWQRSLSVLDDLEHADAEAVRGRLAPVHAPLHIAGPVEGLEGHRSA